MEEIEKIFDTIKHDTESKFQKEILFNSQYTAIHPDLIEFRYRGKDYRIKVEQIPAKNWNVK